MYTALITRGECFAYRIAGHFRGVLFSLRRAPEQKSTCENLYIQIVAYTTTCPLLVVWGLRAVSTTSGTLMHLR